MKEDLKLSPVIMDLVEEHDSSTSNCKHTNTNNNITTRNKNNEKPIAKSQDSSLQDYYVTPETHVAYAFTWFSLSICSLITCYYKFRKPNVIIKKVKDLGKHM